MATEIQLSPTCSLPAHYEAFFPGDAALTRYVKDHADIVYVEKRFNRRRYPEIVAYYAPANVIQEAEDYARRLRQRKQDRAERKKRELLLGAAGRRTIEAFLGLSRDSVSRIIKKYKNIYGEKKAEYLKRVYADWQLAHRQVSQPMRERLLGFLPPFLSIEDKYEIIKQIYRASLSVTTMEVVVRCERDVRVVLAAGQEHLRKPNALAIPSIVHEVASWITNQDSQLCLVLIDRMRQEEEQRLFESLLSQIRMLSEFVATVGVKSSATRVIELPTLKITVKVEKAAIMDSAPDDKRQLAIPNEKSSGCNLPANASSFLDAAIKNADSETVKELTEIAAKEAIKLAVKEKEAEIHGRNTQDALNQAVTTARQLSSLGEDFTIETEERSSTGLTRVTVTKNEPPKPEFKGSCFVATVCYGDPDHPTVLQLRHFRDSVLSRYRSGRYFIAWYYSYGPRIARFVADRAILKRALRCSLRLLAWCLTSKTTRTSLCCRK